MTADPMDTTYPRLIDEIECQRVEIRQLRHALDIARTGLLNIERRSEEARAALTDAVPPLEGNAGTNTDENEPR